MPVPAAGSAAADRAQAPPRPPLERRRRPAAVPRADAVLASLDAPPALWRIRHGDG
jgi:hypothetical protein